MATNASISPRGITYTGGVRDLKAQGNPIKRFDTPKAAYNDLYNDIHKKLNGGSSWVKPSTSLESYISKFAPAEDNNDPKSYTNSMTNRINTELKSSGSKSVITKDTSLGSIKKVLIDAKLNPEHVLTKAHLATEDPKVLKDLNKTITTNLQPVNTKTITPVKNVVDTPLNKNLKVDVKKQEVVVAKKPVVVKKPVLVKKVDEAKPSVNNEQSTSSELKELLNSDLSFEQKAKTIINGIKKNMILEPLAKGESFVDETSYDLKNWIDKNFGTKIHPDPIIASKKRADLINRIKIAQAQKSELMAKESQLIKEKKVDDYYKTVPAISNWDQYDLDKLKFGSRNKRDNNEVNTKGVILQMINPIVDNVNKLQPFQLNQQLIVLNKDTGKISFPSSTKDIPKNSVFSTANKFVVSDFNADEKTKDEKNGTGTYFPTLVKSNGDKMQFTVGASMNDNTRNEGLYGGKMLLISKDGKRKQLFVGSVEKLQRDFYKFKEKTNSSEVTLIQLDQGSYNKIEIPQSGKMTKHDWENYDSKHTSGGHGFYITN